MSAPNQIPGGGYWGYLIKSDKTAAPLLEQLCRGLAGIIGRLKSNATSPKDRLTPDQLAMFYRSVGGDLDHLFMARPPSKSKFNPGLSLTYRMLGCYHSLEPTLDAFESPNVPCLTPEGFIRWQTLSILLSPDEHAAYLQKAVEIYDIPQRDGRIFPKAIPRDAFPKEEDVDMEKWRADIANKLIQNEVHHARNSPFASPTPQAFEREGYFGPQASHIRGPARASTSRPYEDERLRPGSDSRRNSAPHIATPPLSNGQSRPPSSYYKDGKMRSHSTQRNESASRPRSATTGYNSHPQRVSSSAQRSSGVYDRPTSNQSSRMSPRPSPRPYPAPRDRGTNYRPVSASSEGSGGDASSEDSQTYRRSRRREYSPHPENKTRSLLPASLSALNPFSSHKRRHSYDPTSHKERDSSRKRREDAPRSARISPSESSRRSPPHVQFNESVLSNSSQSARASPSHDYRTPGPGQRSSAYSRNGHVPDINISMGSPLTREQSGGSGTDWSGYDSQSRSVRKDGMPLRVSTVAGVRGRRYVTPDAPGLGGAAGNGGGAPQQDSRARYSMAV